MIRTKTVDRSKRFLAGATIALASLGVTACSSIGETPEGPGADNGQGANPNNNGGTNDGENDGGNDGSNDGNGDTNGGTDNNTGEPPTNNGTTGGPTPPPEPPPGPCGTALVNAKLVVETYCASCHGAIPVNNGLSNILDAANLVKRGTVVPDDAENSPLYKRISTNTMPPASVQKRPSADDIQAVRDWIECGAEPFDTPAPVYPFVDIDARLREMLDDVRSIRNDADREDVRYIELYTLANAGFSESQLEEYRQAISFLLNSLSSGLTVVAPRAVGKDRMLFRVDITDYGWDANLWDQVTAAYPYAVVYDQDSELFPYDEATAEQLRDETGEDIPYIAADWFLTNMSKPPLYNILLDLPRDFNELQAQLGVDVAENIADGNVDRAGIDQAGPSNANRIFERHELGGNQGGFWVSYDFSSSVGDQNIFDNQLDFVPDGGEAIFNLPNGFFGYYVMAGDPAGGEAVQLDVGPIAVVQDEFARDGQVTTGLSCMNCHVKGLIVRDDEIRADALRNGAEDINAVLEIYSPVAELRELFEDDNNRYTSANAAAGITVMNDKSMHKLHNTHLDGITIDVVAGVLGIPVAEFKVAIDQASALLPREIVTLRREGGTIDRDALEAAFDDIVLAIGLGQPLNQ
jgi:hypothetical protein